MYQMFYAKAWAALADLLNRVMPNRKARIVPPRSVDSVPLIAADELASLEETAHLLRSPKNAERLFSALARAREGEPATVQELRRPGECP